MWDIMIILMAIFHCFSIPYALAFESPWEELVGIVVLDNFIEVIFFFDIVMEFRTTYIDD